MIRCEDGGVARDAVRVYDLREHVYDCTVAEDLDLAL